MDQQIENVEQSHSLDRIVIENSPPFFDALRPHFELPPEEIIQKSEKFVPSYLAWQTVRHAGSKDRTGFAPYQIGKDSSGNTRTLDQIQQSIADMGTAELKKLDKYPQLKQKVIQTLKEEKVHPEALIWLNGAHGSLTARLRADALQDPEAKAFHDTTHTRVAGRKITYSTEGGKTMQRYELPEIKLPETLNGTSNTEAVSSEGYWFMNNIGKIGHPLVRAGFQAIDLSTTQSFRNQMRR